MLFLLIYVQLLFLDDEGPKLEMSHDGMIEKRSPVKKPRRITQTNKMDTKM